MVTMTRIEIDFQRLLSRCEAMASEITRTDKPIDWRLERFIDTLYNKYLELEKSGSYSGPQSITDYTKRMNFLKCYVENEKSRKRTSEIEQPTTTARYLLNGDSHPDENGKNLHYLARSKYHKDMKEELFSKDIKKKNPLPGQEEASLRKRLLGDENSTDDNVDDDALLKYHRANHEKITEEMAGMAKSLKQTSLLTRAIIQEDNKNLQSINKTADSNYERLKVESDRLSKHVKKPCAWWLWIMLAFVCFIFISMIVFIRIFPKRRY
ncbi:uncharacterized protein TRIADDRAFT_54646 [Trichoplax adhaerens]|uniref:Vesicle transport protein USE1 n=1 Tax=Trichoplax adhaerens TaxID=10228 RepID=B3RSL7_TRIAD|nr:hypothetical protein TRIADDRAFT_54646 [Trichoplax adhaerens]EDV26535.1 hypothetical protein TRIADDRAFT_54646 [Trichoplax adhaerens]|eukprot:XP_002110531.1 hypothetical protein TRIADDRAFT_54646 [Trichoplax adhaerens]